MSPLEADLERRRNAVLITDVVRRELAAERAQRGPGYHPCAYCGAELNVRCCEFGRDR